MMTRILLCSLSILLALSILLLPFTEAASKQPNIIFIVSDDQGYNEFASTNTSRGIQTPNLDELVDTGVCLMCCLLNPTQPNPCYSSTTSFLNILFISSSYSCCSYVGTFYKLLCSTYMFPNPCSSYDWSSS